MGEMRKPRTLSFYRFLIISSILSLFLFIGGLSYIYVYFVLNPPVFMEEKASSSKSSQNALKVSVAKMVSPDNGFREYTQMVTYLAKKVDRPVILIQRKTYQEINYLLKQGELDLAFLSPGAYIDIAQDNQVELFAIPQVRGKLRYQAYIIVCRDSEITRFEDLKGKSFGFEDTLSFAGKLYPIYVIKQMGFTPDTYFSNYVFTDSSDRSLQLLKEGVVDGVSVDNLFFDYLVAQKPKQAREIQVIQKSPVFISPPPVIVRADLDSELKEKLRQALFTMHADNDGVRILSAAGIDKFVSGRNDMYDSLRQMKAAVTNE